MLILVPAHRLPRPRLGGWLCAALATLLLGAASIARAQDKAGSSAATVDQAIQVLDLRTFTRLPGAELVGQEVPARVTYNAANGVQEAFDFLRKELVGQSWHEEAGTYLSDQACSGSFNRDGFKLSVMVAPTAPVKGVAGVQVTLINHGNVDTATLPVPPAALPFYKTAISTAYLLDEPVEATATLVRRQLIEWGWEPYGQAGDVQFFRRNAIRLSARVAGAPAQAGKTFLDYSTELLSAELPAPPSAETVQYSDGPTQLFFDLAGTRDDVVAFYRQALASAGWKATTDQPIRDSFKHFLIFRNPRQDLLNLEMTDYEGKTRVLLRFQTAAEVARLDELARAELERRKHEQMKPPPRLVLAIPTGARVEEASPARIELVTRPGGARTVVQAIQKQLQNEGWKPGPAVVDPMVGSIQLSKDGQSLNVTYVETGVTNAEVTLTAIGCELQTAATAKP